MVLGRRRLFLWLASRVLELRRSAAEGAGSGERVPGEGSGERALGEGSGERTWGRKRRERDGP